MNLGLLRMFVSRSCWISQNGVKRFSFGLKRRSATTVRSRFLLTESRYTGPTEVITQFDLINLYIVKYLHVLRLQPPLLSETCVSYFDKVVSRFGDRTAVVSSHQNIRLSYHDLQEKSTQLARGLASTGVKKGDRVAASLGNNVEFAIVTPLSR